MEHLQRREKDGSPEEVECEFDQILTSQLGKRTEVTDEIEDKLLPGWLSHAAHMAARIHVKLSNLKKSSAQSFPTDLTYSSVIPPLRVCFVFLIILKSVIH